MRIKVAVDSKIIKQQKNKQTYIVEEFWYENGLYVKIETDETGLQRIASNKYLSEESGITITAD